MFGRCRAGDKDSAVRLQCHRCSGHRAQTTRRNYGACAIGTALILASITLKAEDFLSAKFGAAYGDYARRVPRFLPKFSVYRDVDSLTVKPRVVYRTFLESSLFLLAIPAIDAIEVAREFGWLPELMHLP